jgi:hypothetical protein
VWEAARAFECRALQEGLGGDPVEQVQGECKASERRVRRVRGE